MLIKHSIKNELEDHSQLNNSLSEIIKKQALMLVLNFWRAARCKFLSAQYPFPTQSYNNVHSKVQVIYFQKIPVVLSKCGAIAI